MHRSPALFALLMVLASAGPASAGDFFDSPKLSDRELEEARGGFDLADGVRVSFGVLINTQVNGISVLKTELAVADNAVQGSASGETATVSLTNRGVSASAAIPQFSVQHDIGQRIASQIVNTGDCRIVDNQVTINLQLDNVQPLTIGGTMFRVRGLGVDAALWRGAGG